MERTFSAYKNDPKLRADFIAEMAWHQEQDKIKQGTYGEGDNGNFRGCAIGCSIHSLSRFRGERLETSRHSVLEDYLDIPAGLAHLFDGVFEWLPLPLAKKFPLRFASAIPCGADLKMVVPKFLYWVLTDIPQPADEPAELTEFMDELIAIHADWVTTGTLSLDSLASISSLDSLDRLANLDSISILASISRLASLDSLDRLDRLARLARLASLASLDSLACLASLAKLSRLSRLARLASLDKLACLASLARFDRLDRLDRLEERSADQLIGLLEASK